MIFERWLALSEIGVNRQHPHGFLNQVAKSRTHSCAPNARRWIAEAMKILPFL
jgi:hypothetical protein